MPARIKGSPTKQQLCICQICTCGRHRCPHRPGTSLRFEKGDANGAHFHTEYDEKFKLLGPAERPKGYRLNDNLGVNGGTIEDLTTNRSDYVAHEVKRQDHGLRQQGYVKPEGEMVTSSLYMSEYDKKDVERSRPIRHESTLKNASDPFQAAPLYKEDFKSWPLERASPMKLGESGVLKLNGAFDATTTNKEDFKENQVTPRGKGLRPTSNLKLENGAMDSQTSHRSDFTQHPLQARNAPVKQTYEPSTSPLDAVTTHRSEYTAKRGERATFERPRTTNKFEGDQFDGSTTLKESYRGLPGEKQKSFKPQATAAISTTPFDSVSTLQSDYKAWDMPQKQEKRKEAYTKPEGALDLTTTHQMDFVEVKTDRPRQRRPETATKVGEGEFQSGTTHKDTFRGVAAEKAASFKPLETAAISDSPFQAETTLQADYKPWQARKADPIRHGESLRNEGSLDLLTTHQQAYVELSPGRQTPVKPADAGKLLEGDFEGTTTQRLDFTEKPVVRERFKRPETTKLQSGPFQSETTANSSYQVWHPSRPEGRKAEAYVKPEGDMDLRTTMELDYIPVQGERQRAVRPAVSPIPSGPFQGNTTNRADFRQWSSGGIADRVVHRQEYRPPSGEFAGYTTHRADFIKMPTAKQQLHRPPPDSNVVYGNGDLANGGPLSSYRSEFQSHEHLFHHCPAEGLGNYRDNEQFHFRSELSGHHFYLPIAGQA